MANKFRGEKQFTVGDKTFTLVFDTNAICALEQALGTSFIELARRAAETRAPRIGEARAMLWAGMLRHHPSTSLEKCGELIDEPDMGFIKVFNLCWEAMKHCFPNTEANGGNVQAAPGTGSNS